MFRDSAVSPVSGGVTPPLRAMRRSQTLGVIALVLAVAGVVVWAVLARPATTVSGIGLLAGENALTQSVAPVTGLVAEVHFDREDQLSVGDRLITIRTADDDIVEVQAFTDAQVLLRLIEAGGWVEAGQPIAELFHPNDLSTAVVAVDEGDAAQIAVGQRALVAVRQAPAGQFGSIPATVAWVTAVPVDAQRLTLLAGGNQRLAGELDPGIGVVLAGLDLDLDPTTASGFAWTGGNGPAAPLPPAAIIDVEITTGSFAPAELLIGQ
jgi:multidrug resistance efflux pump